MIERVAFLTIHTSPLVQPGSGDAGGMNVYIDGLARAMASRGVAVDVFTRRTGRELADVVEVVAGYQVVHVDAGPAQPLAVDELPDVVGEFAEGVVKWAYTNQVRYDVVHSHYWLSGWAGVLVKEALGIPLANSFHTLGRVKDATRRPDDPPSGLLRIATETGVIDSSDCVVASTPAEAEDLIEHYAATPERLCVSPPGIDHGVFTPGSRSDARRRLGIGGDPVLAFVGRIQPLKGADVAVEAAALLSGRFPDLTLVVVGGPSGPSGDDEMARLRRVSAAAGIEGQVEFRTPQPQGDLVDYYRAADVLVVPSRSESFGLVAVEAQACGTPVIAAEVGGLGFAVEDGESGYLIDGWDPAAYAGAASAILGNAVLARRLSEGAIDLAARFSWPATVDRFLELYDGIIGNDSQAEAERLLRDLTTAWVDDPGSDVVWAGAHEGRWGLRLAQQARDFTTVWFDVGERTLGIEAYVLPAPPLEREQVYRHCLVRNATAWRVHFALDRDGDVYLRGRLPLDAVSEEALDATVGAVYEIVELSFRALIRLGFESREKTT